MKKKNRIILISVLSVFMFALIFSLLVITSNPFSEEEIKSIVDGKIKVICSEALQTYSEETSTCPYCRETTLQISKGWKLYNVNGTTRLAWENRNDQPGYYHFYLEINKKGEIILFDSESLECIY